MNPLNENNLAELSLIEWLQGQGYEYMYGPAMAPNQPSAEREDFRGVVLKNRLLASVRRFNPQLPAPQAQQVVDDIASYHNADAMLGNKEMFTFITEGVKKTWQENGAEKTEVVKLIDFENVEANDFLITNQFTVQGIENVCRLDGVVFVNGIPLSVLELKSPVREQATIGQAYRDMEYYKKEIPKMFLYNQVLCLSDLKEARHGTISSSWERYGVWKGIDSEADAPSGASELEVLVKGLFDKKRFLDLIQNFIVFEADGDGDAVTYTKKMALYHQYYGVNKTINSTVRAVGEGALRRAADLLAAKLQKEGLFDPTRKRALPYPPKTIALITAGDSAAYADFIKVTNTRWGGLRITHYNVLVQGEHAPGEIVAALKTVNGCDTLPDVIVLVRGGGKFLKECGRFR
jgi:type I restriction enzyme R subunit